MGELRHDGKEGDIIMGDGSKCISKGICTEDGGINANKIGEKSSYKKILADSSPIFSASAEFDGIFRRIPVETECGGASGNGGRATAIDVDSHKEEMSSLVMAEEKMVRFLLSVRKFFLCPPMRT